MPDPTRRPSLKEDLLRLDRELLHLLLRRFNLLERLRGKRGYILPAEEKELREAWTQEALRVSSDPTLSSKFFALLNELRFFPKPLEGSTQKRKGFNLAPPQKPVTIRLPLPASQWHVHAMMLLAAETGKELSVRHTLMHDAQHALLRALSDEGCSISTKDDTLTLFAGAPCPWKDISIHCANDYDLFALFLAHYLLRPSRVRCTADGALKNVSLLSLSHLLPQLGARMHAVLPKGTSFPVRIECVGELPATITVPSDIPTSFAEALLVALACAESETTLVCDHTLGRAQALLRSCGITISKDLDKITVTPGSCSFPKHIPVEASAAGYILAIPLLVGGSITAEGIWPDDPTSQALWDLLRALGLKLTQTDAHILAKADPAKIKDRPELPSFPDILQNSVHTPLLAGLTAAYVLQGHTMPWSLHLDATGEEFFALLGITADEQGFHKTSKNTPQVLWNAPSATWAMALALAALARQGEGFKLGNPGVITELWPQFWSVYNSLPELDRSQKPAEQEAPRRRRYTLEPSDADR